MPRKILHLDLDAFFCSVEELHNPDLRGKPFAVGGRPDQRGVVASCSYAARRFGVRSAMPMARALQLCPELLIVPSRHGVYSQVSAQVMERLHNLTPLVEQVSIDEAFLDVSDLPDPVEDIARRLQTQIRTELSLPCSIGAATSKLLAKTANDVGKAAARGDGPPNAITVVPPGQEAAFLAPLPVGALFGVGPKTAARLEELGIYTIGDLARRSPEEMERRFGRSGFEMVLRARGIDDRPLETSRETKSISQETTFARDIRDEHTLKRTLLRLSEGVGRRLRREGLAGTTVKIKLRWEDFTTLTRQVTLPQPSNLDHEIYAAALYQFNSNWPPGRP
ncbi:MAG: DNA polymerase IV, partial [Chloroflexi bacterium]|nr:DNA polymerase IV [Chloroflexota bacterium]